MTRLKKIKYNLFTLYVLIITLSLIIGISQTGFSKQTTHKSLTAHIIKLIQTNMTSWNTVIIPFTQYSHIELLQKTVSKKGTFTLSKNNQWRLAYQDMDSDHYFFTGHDLWIFDPHSTATESIEISKKDMHVQMMSLFQSPKSIRRLFRIMHAEKKSIDQYILTLRPKHKSSPYKKLTLACNAIGRITSLILTHQTGNETTYIFADYQINPTLPMYWFMPKKSSSHN